MESFQFLEYCRKLAIDVANYCTAGNMLVNETFTAMKLSSDCVESLNIQVS